MASDPTNDRAQALTPVGVWWVVGVYALFASLWILLSDTALAWLVTDPSWRAIAGTLKGGVFVAVTAALLFGLVRRLLERQAAALRKEGEAQAAQSQALGLLQSLVEASPDAIFAKDRQGRYLLFNREAARVTGTDAAAMIGQDDHAAFPPEHVAQIRANDERVMARDHAETFEETLSTAGGPRVFLATKGPLRDAHGRVIGIYGISRDVTERIRAEEALRRSELRYRLAASNGTVWDWDPATGRLEIAPSWWTRLGHPVPEGDPVQALIDVFHPDDLPLWRRQMREHLVQRKPFDFEYRTRHADGSLHWFHTQGQAVWDDAGRATYMAGTTFEITPRKRALEALHEREEALRVSELRYRLAAANGQVWDWDFTSGRSLIGFASKFWRQLGHEPPSPDRLLDAFAALLHPDDLPRWHRAMRDHLMHRRPYTLEFRAGDASGHWHWYHTQGQAVWGDDGRATYMAGTTFDITDRKEAEAALLQSERYRLQALEQLSEGVLMVDRELRIVDANPAALDMLRHERKDLLRLRVHDLIATTDHARVEAAARNVIVGGHSLEEWECVRRDGSRFPAVVDARRLDDDRMLAVLRDITEQRRHERAQLAYQFELSELTQRLLTQEKQTTQRVAQALHDRLGQTLAVARLNLAAYAAKAPPDRAEDTPQPALDAVDGLLGQAIGEVRQVLADLRPPLLDEQGLAAALDNEIASHVQAADGADVLLEASDAGVTQRWPADVEYGAFMIAREAIANARQHAGASLIRVALDGSRRAMALDIVDDGRGIPAELAQGRAGHLGIVGMRERALAIGAQFTVRPIASGGTQVQLRWKARRP